MRDRDFRRQQPGDAIADFLSQQQLDHRRVRLRADQTPLVQLDEEVRDVGGSRRVVLVHVIDDDGVAHAQCGRERHDVLGTEPLEQRVRRVVAGDLDHAADRILGAEPQDWLVEGERSRLLLPVRLGEHDQLVERGGDVDRTGGALAAHPRGQVVDDEGDASLEVRGSGVQFVAHLSKRPALSLDGRGEGGRRE